MVVSSVVWPTVRVEQRSEQDCLLCAYAMFARLSYDEAVTEARTIIPSYDPATMPMTHSLMRRMAHEAGLVLVSSIYMDWRYPGIVGVISRTIENCGHALFWTGQALIDPGPDELYSKDYVQSAALEFTQRAQDVAELVALGNRHMATSKMAVLEEHF